MKKIMIDERLVVAIRSYLGKCPFDEVAPLLQALVNEMNAASKQKEEPKAEVKE